MSELGARAAARAGRAEPGGHPRADARSWLMVLKGAKQRIKADDVPSLAASVAFKIFLSLFPSLIAGVAIASQVASRQQLLDLFRQQQFVLPPGVTGLIEDRLESLVDTPGAGGIALAGIAAGLWAATSAAATLIKALNRINAVEEHRGFVVQRALALLLTVGLVVTLLVVVAVVVLGPWVREQMRAALDLPLNLGVVGTGLWVLAHVVVAVAALIGFFAFVYWVGPNRERPQWRWISAGSITGVVGWLALSAGFSAFVQTLGAYEQTYGSLATVAITLLWLQLSMMMLLLGAEIDVEIAREQETAQALEEGAGMTVMEPPPVVPDAGVARAGAAADTAAPGSRERFAAGQARASGGWAPIADGLPTPEGRRAVAPPERLVSLEAARPSRAAAAGAGLGALAIAVRLAWRRR